MKYQSQFCFVIRSLGSLVIIFSIFNTHEKRVCSQNQCTLYMYFFQLILSHDKKCYIRRVKIVRNLTKPYYIVVTYYVVGSCNLLVEVRGYRPTIIVCRQLWSIKCRKRTAGTGYSVPNSWECFMVLFNVSWVTWVRPQRSWCVSSAKHEIRNQNTSVQSF